MKAESETNLSISDQLKLSNKGYKIAVALAIIFVFSLLIGYYFVTRQPPEPYSTIYLLDQQEKAIDYPELLVINNNNTFSVYVVVENHMGAKKDFEVLQKVVNDAIPSFPVEAPVERSQHGKHDKDQESHNPRSGKKVPGERIFLLSL